MTDRRFLLAVVAAVVTMSAAAPAQDSRLSSAAPPARFTDPVRLEKLRGAIPAIDSVMRGFAERSRVPGIAYGIIVDGRLIHVGAAGIREVATRSPVDTNTVFRIASMSKSFAAASILQLRDAGKLSLDDPAERYVPELASLRYPGSDAPKITIRHLLSHSGGFPEDNPWGDQQLAATDAELAAMIRSGIPFSTAPGTAFEYSNYGFAILGRIVANVSGMSYARYLTQNILQPLGMHSTTLEVARVPASRLAHGYRLQDNVWLEEEQLPDGAFGPMGGMLTSVSDLGRWVSVMLDAWPARDGPETGPIRRASLREMQQIARYTGVSASSDTTNALTVWAGGYGYGLEVYESCDFRTAVSHSGGLPGFGSLMWWLPDHGVGIVAMGNVTYTGWDPPVERAVELLRLTGGLSARAPQPSPVLLERQAQAARLIMRWDDALADSLAAMNLFRDRSKVLRRAAMERIMSEAGGECRPEGDIVAANALRGRWRMRCKTGDFVVGITLAPTEPALVQSLRFAPIARDQPVPAAGPACTPAAS